MLNDLIEIELTPKQVDLLFPALKQAESAFTNQRNWKAASAISKLYDTLHRQIYTYGQMEETND